MTFGSLFSGIGGLDLGLAWAGMTPRWQVEIDPWCRRVLATHWPEVTRYEDIRECGSHNLEPVDLIAGGFPCQDISTAGKGAGLAGERSGLWREYARVVCELRPAYVLVENVLALRSRGLDQVVADLAASGYDAEWECLPAAAVGAPQVRDRVFLVAYPHRERPRPEDPAVYASRPDVHQLHPVGRSANEGREVFASPGAVCWSSEPSVGRMADGVSSRLDRCRLKGLGNAVVPQVAQLVGSMILRAEANRVSAHPRRRAPLPNHRRRADEAVA